MLSLFALTTTTPNVSIVSQYEQVITIPNTQTKVASIPIVPFYSQFKDITSSTWQKVGCGVTSLAMIINYYQPDAVSVNALLTRGIAAGAYLNSAGWTYSGLINLSHKYGLDGQSYDLATLSATSALNKLKPYLADGPIIASIHYKFDPKSTIPHLIVINGIKGDTIYYNDPAAKTGAKEISTADFLKGWKKRFIVIRPTKSTLALATIQAQ